jgi:hypothetical protein
VNPSQESEGSRLNAAAAVCEKDLQLKQHSPPVESETSIWVNGDLFRNINLRKRWQRTFGFVPLHIANVSLESIELNKGVYVGEAFAIFCEDVDCDTEMAYEMHAVQGVEKVTKRTMHKFDEYLQDKLQHLTRNNRELLGAVLTKCRHLFYGIDNAT